MTKTDDFAMIQASQTMPTGGLNYLKILGNIQISPGLTSIYYSYSQIPNGVVLPVGIKTDSVIDMPDNNIDVP